MLRSLVGSEMCIRDSVEAGLNIRPFAQDVLELANKYFEVIIFTASLQSYADVVIDILDPDRELVHHRLYRESCVITDGVYVKDMRIFKDRKLTDIMLIDNSAYSFAYQLFNGIPIIPWFNDPEDTELKKLATYLKFVSTVPDVREVNKQAFKLHSFGKEYCK